MVVVNCSLSPLVLPPQAIDYSQGRIHLSFGLYLVLTISSLVAPVIFYWGKRYARYERLRLRRTVLVLSASVCCLIQAQSGSGFIVFGVANYPCWLRSLFIMLIIPLYCSNILSRFMVFFFLSELSREIVGINLDEVPDPYNERDSYVLKLSYAIADIFYACYCLLNPAKTSINLSKARLIQALSFAASTKGTIFVFSVIFFPFLIIAAVIVFSNPVNLVCKGCLQSPGETYEVVTVGLFFIVFGILAAIKVKDYPDPWRLRRECVWIVVFGSVALTGFILDNVVNISPSSVFDLQLIIVLGMFGFLSVQTWYQVLAAQLKEGMNFKQIGLYCDKRVRQGNHALGSVKDETQNTNKESSQLNSTHRLTMKDLFQNPSLLASFENFLISELGVESLAFLRDTNEWQKAYYDIAQSARLLRAKKLYNIYISPSGQLPVNISAKLINDSKSALFRDGNHDVPFTVFDAARLEIEDLLNVGAIMRFQQSNDYPVSSTETQEHLSIKVQPIN